MAEPVGRRPTDAKAPPVDALSPAARAQECGAVMWARDLASQGLGISLDRVTPGGARLTLTVEPRHLNGHGICHGGFTFTLADTAFAFACNSYDRATVAQQNAITYLAPSHVGDRLTATAVEVSRLGRSGVYDVMVANQRGETIALFRGHCREIGGRILEEDPDHD